MNGDKVSGSPPAQRLTQLVNVRVSPGEAARWSAAAAAAGLSRPLIVTDPGVKAVGILQQALDALPGLSVAVYDQTPSNPTEAAVRAAVAVYHAQGCDGLIAVGGGSAIDCAKGVAIAATHEGPLKTYATIEGGSPKITERVAPLIAVPTTAGTGSETQSFALISDSKTHVKMACGDKKASFRIALLDPLLTVSQPQMVTALTGIDAIAHALDDARIPKSAVSYIPNSP